MVSVLQRVVCVHLHEIIVCFAWGINRGLFLFFSARQFVYNSSDSLNMAGRLQLLFGGSLAPCR